MSAPAIAWQSAEHKHKEVKTQDWFWALGFIAISAAVTSILLSNVLLAMIILLAAITLGLYANKAPQELSCSLSTRGITINEVLHPYKNLEAFWIDETHPDKDHNSLILDARKPLVPHLIIPLPPDLDRDVLQDYLLDYLPEKELFEPPAQRIAELFGF